jgi:hypothetical protein
MSALGGAVMPRPLKQARRAIYTTTNPAGAVGGAVEDAIVDALRVSRRSSRRPTHVARPRADASARYLQFEEAIQENAALDQILQAHMTPIESSLPPRASEPEPVNESAIRRKREREAKRGIRIWHRADRRAAREAAADIAAREARAERGRRQRACEKQQEELDEQWAALLDNEAGAVSDAIVNSLADTPYPVLAVGASASTAVAFVGFPDVDVVPDRFPASTPTGRPTVRKRSKTERNELYAEALASFTLANAKKVLGVAPGAQSVVVVTLRPYGSEDGWEPVARGRFTRAELEETEFTSPALHVFAEVGGRLARRGRTGQIEAVDFDDEAELAALVDPMKRGSEGVRRAASALPDGGRLRLTVAE